MVLDKQKKKKKKKKANINKKASQVSLREQREKNEFLFIRNLISLLLSYVLTVSSLSVGVAISFRPAICLDYLIN